MDELQFEKAEFAGDGPKCASCQAPIESEYYHLAGQVICPQCAEKVRNGQQRPPNSAVLRGLLFGAGMAAACCVGYGLILLLTGLEIGIVAIAVGFLVGKAVRKGSNGLGGRRVQIIAVVLTYFAITWSYVPLIVKSVYEAQQKQENAAKDAGKKDADKQVVTGDEAPITAMGAILAVALLTGLAMAAPILELGEGLGGILGIAIIGFGLLQAWRMAARDERLLMGPYQREEAASA